MRLLESIRPAIPLALPIIASVAAVVLLAEGYSITNKIAQYEHLRGEHEALIVSVGERRRAAEDARSDLAAVTGQLNGAREGMRSVTAEREDALRQTAVARAEKEKAELQRSHLDEQARSLQIEIEKKNAELKGIKETIIAVGAQMVVDQAKQSDAESKARIAKDNADRATRGAAEAEERRASLDKSANDASGRLATLRRDVDAAEKELMQRRQESQSVVGETNVLKAQIPQLRRDAEAATKSLSDLQQRQTSAQTEITDLQKQSADLNAAASQKAKTSSGLSSDCGKSAKSRQAQTFPCVRRAQRRTASAMK